MAPDRIGEPDDWGVFVDECGTFACRMGADWWVTYSARFVGSGRITELDMSLGGGHYHVACDDRQDAEQTRQMMIYVGGMHAKHVRVKRLRDCRSEVRRRHLKLGDGHACNFCRMEAAA
jgi:hypothetical protein